MPLNKKQNKLTITNISLCLCLTLVGCSTKQWDASFLQIAGYNTQWQVKHLPIKISKNACDQHFTVCDAALEINNLIGKQIFDVVKGPKQLPNLLIKDCHKNCGKVGGTSVLHFKNQYIVGATIKIRKMNPPQMRLVALHELGHVLGLAHDEDPTSIMNQNIESFFITEKRFTQLDILALRRLYR